MLCSGALGQATELAWHPPAAGSDVWYCSSGLTLQGSAVKNKVSMQRHNEVSPRATLTHLNQSLLCPVESRAVQLVSALAACSYCRNPSIVRLCRSCSPGQSGVSTETTGNIFCGWHSPHGLAHCPCSGGWVSRRLRQPYFSLTPDSYQGYFLDFHRNYS